MSNKKSNIRRVRVQLRLSISKRAKEKLDRKAAQSGLSPAEIAQNLIERAFGAREVDESSDKAQRVAACEAWVAGMRNWGRKHLPRGHQLNDGRESIYE